MNYSKNHIKRIAHKIVCAIPNKHNENQKTKGYSTKYHMWHTIFAKLYAQRKSVYKGE